MRILMLSWEFPPRSVGGLSQHVYDLSTALVRNGDEVHVLTCSAPGAAAQEVAKGVNVYRVNPYDLSTPDFLTWVLQLNLSLVEQAIGLFHQIGGCDLIHAHDWLVAYAGRVIKHSYRLPLVATIHATEYGRNWGLHNDLQRYIGNVEWWLTYEAWRVIVCSRYMEQEVKNVFNLPQDKIRVIPNGVDLRRYQGRGGKQLARSDFAAPDEKIVLFVGRMVYEKGAHLLVEAVPKILHYHPRTKVIMAGQGPALEYLQKRARDLGVYNRIYFTGYIDETTRDFLYREADVAVFPSLYEPFGMVVLEAMAAGTPVVVADTGGLAEIVEHEKNGLKSYPNNPGSLADNILRLLHLPHLARSLAEQAGRDLQEFYTWREIARQTRRVYQDVLEEYTRSSWGAEKRRVEHQGLQSGQRSAAGWDRYLQTGYPPGVHEEVRPEVGGSYH